MLVTLILPSSHNRAKKSRSKCRFRAEKSLQSRTNPIQNGVGTLRAELASITSSSSSQRRVRISGSIRLRLENLEKVSYESPKRPVEKGDRRVAC